MQTKQDSITFFLSFCVEMYKNAHALSGAQAFETLSSSEALRFLEKNYEPIHTQSAQWILEEIEEFLNTQNTSK
ncbi:MAG: DUF3791 domain-containing protein [Bacteroides sp.]|nr:DUF3791 domain-containing protein [Bacteroides sp.]